MHELSLPAGVPAECARSSRRPVVALAVALLAAGLAASLAPITVAAQDAVLYQVEVVIFSQPDGSTERRPRPRPAPSPSLEFGDLALEPDAAAGQPEDAAGPSEAEEATSWLPEGFTRARLPLALESAAARLNRGGYQLLWHQAWVQPPTDRGAMELALLAGLGQGPANANLSGAIQLSSARFLHLALDLELQSAGVPVAELRQRRRVGTSIQQYYDHPHIGVIALVTPVPIDPDQSGSP